MTYSQVILLFSAKYVKKLGILRGETNVYTSDMAKLTFAKFIKQEMGRAGTDSNRKFAELMGVSPQLINDIINEAPREFEMSTLRIISEFTHTPLLTILALAFPDVAEEGIDVDALREAEMISKLPTDKRDIITRYINDAYTKGDE